MSASARDTPESGELPGRYEWVEEPAPGEAPTDPAWNLFSDIMRSFEAEAGASKSRQDGLGTPDAVDHNRGTEEPSLTAGYDLQRFPVDAAGDPIDPSGYGLIRDQYNQLPGTLMVVGRREHPGGNDGAGVREYTVARGAAVSSVSPTLDPSEENPILMELEHQTQKVRSYLIHQPSASTLLVVKSSSANDTTQSVTIENEGAGTAETVVLNGTSLVSTSATFGDIDAVSLDAETEGDVTVAINTGTETSPAEGTTLMTIEGGLTYSDDDQPVDGDLGVPALGTGSHAAALGTKFEHFVGDRFERPAGSAVRPRVNSAGWTVENGIETSSMSHTRAPAVDEGNRAVSVEADVAGPFVSHRSMMEALQNDQADLEHELSGGVITFKNTTPTDSATRTVENEQSAASMSETFEASGDPAIVLTAN